MLDWESERFDLQEVRLSQQPVEIQAQGVGSQFGVQPGAQAPEGMGMVDFDMKLVGELCINGFNSLAAGVEELLVEGLHQSPLPPMETALRGQVQKQVPMRLPSTEHFRLHVPAPAFAHQGQGDQIGVRALGCWPRTVEARSQCQPQIVHDDVHLCAKNRKSPALWPYPPASIWRSLVRTSIITLEDFLSTSIRP